MTQLLANSPKPLNDCGQVRYGRPSKSNLWEAVGRTDYQWSDKHSLFGRYYATHIFTPTPYSLAPGNYLNTATGGTDALVQSYALGSTYLIGPNTVNAFRLSVSRVKSQTLSTDLFSLCDLGAKIYCGYAPKRMSVTITRHPCAASMRASPTSVAVPGLSRTVPNRSRAAVACGP